MCYTPFTIENPAYPVNSYKRSIQVDCGKCEECRKQRAGAWSFRLLQELKISTSAFFVTLSYANDFLPISTNGIPTLDYEDVKKFWKRLRKANNLLTSKSIRYYVVGEYGSKRHRPHYHAIVFNVSDKSLFSSCWSLGHVHVGTVSIRSIMYTCNYVSKPRIVPQFRNDDRKPEFNSMSKGIGANYVTPSIIKWHNEKLFERVFVTIPYSNVRYKMPRFYKQRIYSDFNRLLISRYYDQQLDKLFLLSPDEYKLYIQRLNNSIYNYHRKNGSDFLRVVF